jgi:ornithine cyclodeaminase
MRSLVLARSDVVRHLDALTLMGWLREGFIAHSQPERAASEQTVIRYPGRQEVIPVWGRLAFDRLPGTDGEAIPLLQLFDADSDRLLAVLHAAQLTSITSAVSCAIAADALARPEAARVAVIGAGAHAGAQLKSLRLVRTVEHIRVYDQDLIRMAEFAERMYRELSVPVRMADSSEEAVSDADIVLAVTDSGQPFLFPGMVGAGCHLTSVGANITGHQELAANLIRQSRFFCDDRKRALAPDALPSMGLGADVIAAELGEVLAQTQPGRTSPEEITLFAAYGLPHQVLTAAWLVYQGAREDEDIPALELDPSGRPLS